jgi:prophage antirepressor-like protein
MSDHCTPSQFIIGQRRTTDGYSQPDRNTVTIRYGTIGNYVDQEDESVTRGYTLGSRAPNIVLFEFDTRPVRTVMIDGQPWFVASDLCAILEIENARDAVRSLPQKGVVTSYTLTQGGPQKLKVVNEPNLYRLVFRSRKPEAEKFQDWIYETVIPAIRKTGQYKIDLRGWLSNAPKPWAKTFPNRYYTEILRLYGKDPTRTRDQEPWLAQLTDFLIYRRLAPGFVEALRSVNPVPKGKRWRRCKHHQHVNAGEAEKQFNRLLGECVGVLCAAKNWSDFLTIWNSLHPLVESLGFDVALADSQLTFFDFFAGKKLPVRNF